jgi:hypothetical protein
MIIIQSWLKVADTLVPVEDFRGPVLDEDYIEGSIELSVEHIDLLTRDMVDYIDQLWAYLIRGLGEVVAGTEFSTFYPDMPLQVMLRPQGRDVTIIVDPPKLNHVASVPIASLVAAMVPAGTRFFERLRQYAPSNRSMYDRHISRLAALAISAQG